MPSFFARVAEHISGAWYWLKGNLLDATIDASQVNAQLWTGGGIETDEDVAWLLTHGVTADVDMREEFDDRPLLASKKLAYLWVPQADDGNAKPTSDYQAIWEFAKSVLASGGVVYCHCAAGHNRGPSAAYFLLRAYWKMSPADAYGLIKEKRPVVTLAYASSADTAITALGL